MRQQDPTRLSRIRDRPHDSSIEDRTEESEWDRDLTGPVVVFICDSYQDGLTEVQTLIRLLMMLSGAIEQLAGFHVFDPPDTKCLLK